MSDDKRTHQGKPRSVGIRSVPVAHPTNWLVPVTLVLLRQWRSYGYELIERSVELGFEAMNPGNVYRTLRKLEKDGFCKSRWETASRGPARRVYSITDPGAAYLELWVKSLKQYQQTIDTFLQVYRSGSSRSSGS